MTRTTLAVAADYADALLVARRSKNALFLLILLGLLLQLAVFFLYRYDVLRLAPRAGDVATVAADVPAASTQSHGVVISADVYRWAVNVSSFLVVAFMIVLAVVLLLTAIIMLVGRLIGVSYVTSAFVWCAFLGVLLFPWQSVLTTNVYTGLSTASAMKEADPKVPGILFTWPEIATTGHFDAKQIWPEGVLHWARFAGWPVVAILLLMIIQAKSSRGLRFALGESDIPVDVAPAKTEHELEI